MKVLVIGFPRSGTSLTFRIFKRHQDIDRMYYESLLLWRHKGKKIGNLFPGLARGQNGGEKIIYEKPFIGKKKDDSFIDYCDWWNKEFGNEARIIQIVRHPYDSWNSVVKKKYIARKIPNSICINLKRYFSCVPEYTKKIMKYDNAFTFKLEHLISNPEVILNRLYDHCGLDPGRSNFVEKMKSNKFFNFKKTGFCIDTNGKVKHMRDEYWEIMNRNLPDLLNIMNEIEGPKYEL